MRHQLAKYRLGTCVYIILDDEDKSVWELIQQSRQNKRCSLTSAPPTTVFRAVSPSAACLSSPGELWHIQRYLLKKMRTESHRGTTIFIAAPPGFSSSQMNWFSVQLGIDVTQSINSGEMNLQWFLILCSGSHAFEHHLKRTKIDSIEFRISKNAMDIVLRLVSKWTQDFVLTSDTLRKRKKSRLSAF